MTKSSPLVFLIRHHGLKGKDNLDTTIVYVTEVEYHFTTTCSIQSQIKTITNRLFACTHCIRTIIKTFRWTFRSKIIIYNVG